MRHARWQEQALIRMDLSVAGSGFTRKDGLIQTQQSKAHHEPASGMKVKMGCARGEAAGVGLAGAGWQPV